MDHHIGLHLSEDILHLALRRYVSRVIFNAREPIAGGVKVEDRDICLPLRESGAVGGIDCMVGGCGIGRKVGIGGKVREVEELVDDVMTEKTTTAYYQDIAYVCRSLASCGRSHPVK